MRFVCSSFGSSGDVYPMFGLALELRRRGHDITFATNAHFAGLAKKYQVPFEPLGTEADFEASVSNPDLWNPRRAFGHVIRSLLPVLRRHYELHEELISQGPLVSLTNCFGFGALLAREKFGIPVYTIHLQPAVLWSDIEPPTLPRLFGPRWFQRFLYRVAEKYVIDPAVCPFLNAWRAELNLPPVSKITRWWHSPDGIVCMFPEWFAPPQPDWPAPRMQTDFPLWNDLSEVPLSGAVQTFLEAGEPPIVFTPGTANVHGQDFFAAAVHACQTLGRRGVLLTRFARQIPSKLPEQIAHFEYVPLDLLLPRSAAFVHHGGIGSMSQGILAGVPQVLMPLAHDQYDNAQRIRRMGLGDFIPAPRFTGSRLVRILKSVLERPSVTAACRQAATRLVPRDGLQRTADALEARILGR